MVIQFLSERHDVRMAARRVSAVDGRPAGVSGDYQIGDQTVRLLMPLTMMNESGEALRDLEVPPQDLLVVCDDVNLPLGTEDVPRLRIGVGTTELPRELTDFVLSPFQSTERPVITRAIEQAAEACEQWVTEGMDAVMNRYNNTQDAP